MTTCAITTGNIERFRGELTLKPGDLPYEIWDVFDRAAFDAAENAYVVQVQCLVSTKNQLLDPRFQQGEKTDPRQTAFNLMSSAAMGHRARRPPLKVLPIREHSYQIKDGNATAQVLMLVGWSEVPVEIPEAG
jgi:hypothetical protein